jgi:hypothetical protein
MLQSVETIVQRRKITHPCDVARVYSFFVRRLRCRETEIRRDDRFWREYGEPLTTVTAIARRFAMGTSLLAASIETNTIFVALVLAILGLVSAVRTLRKTTLFAAWGWSLLAITSLLWLHVAEATQSLLAVFAASVLTLGPAVAVLGAKRPQHHTWQFIVVTSLVVLGMPAAEGWVFGAGRMPELHVARQMLLVGMVFVGWCNYIGTRWGVAVTLLAAGQITLLAPYVGWFAPLRSPTSVTRGTLLIVAAIVVAWLMKRRKIVASNALTEPWLPFRDLVGAAWALRVAERFNATAKANDWPIELTWRGLRSTAANRPLETIDPVWTQCCDALLRRFVSREWIAEHRVSDEAADSTSRAE